MVRDIPPQEANLPQDGQERLKKQSMSMRVKISVLLVLLGLFLALFPGREVSRFRISPEALALWTAIDSLEVTPDEVARRINAEDPLMTLIDVRSLAESGACRLTGALRIPLEELTLARHRELLLRKEGFNVFYSNGDEASAAALALSAGVGGTRNFRMKGGLNGWFETVMQSSFTGERISARENALFTQRFNARKLFNQYNALPDSLRETLFVSRRLEKAKLDGGCE